jgi:hypothetical protein
MENNKEDMIDISILASQPHFSTEEHRKEDAVDTDQETWENEGGAVPQQERITKGD